MTWKCNRWIQHQQAEVQAQVQTRAQVQTQVENLAQTQVQTQVQLQPQVEAQAQAQAQTNALPSKPKAGVPIYKATITELAQPSQMKPATATILNDDPAIQRIKKCLSRANHPGTPEFEAKAALHMASRLMAQHNFAGQSIVAIRRSDGDRHKIVRIQGYIDCLADAITTFFNCKHYSERVYGPVNFIFYGLADNTVAAATAFEMVYNLMTTWALKYPGQDRTSYLLGVCETLRKTAEKEAVDEVERAKEAEKDAVMTQPPLEETQRQANMDRTWLTNDAAEVILSLESPETTPLAGFTDGVSVESSHDDQNAAATVHSEAVNGDENDDGIDGCIEPDFHTEASSRIDPSMDIDEEIHRLASITKHPPQQLNAEFVTSSRPSNLGQDSTVKPHREEPDGVYTKHHTQGSNDQSAPIPPLNNEGTWKSHMQLVVFRKSAENIADDYLKNQGTKLVAGKSRSRRVHNMTAYRQGSQDSKKIDVRRRMIS
ncbi:hypothetical protein BGZ61DRAFT_370616 [Ilyonectria robusta]|uniref:uncharacterized protein n=1 Tax=Ilyonectria robusta TaxID=1079257 RepID=UPI001E8D41C7|nr:uncharacterized protein BGZ61DRAFT_370616 [Ilyonectria robusta]KAH8659434.1 hypothetical protein BGZ61DRAFT_370616 [Ilyonectria robusta]